LIPFALGTLAFLALTGGTAAGAEMKATLRVCGAHACTTIKTAASRLQPLTFDDSRSSPRPPPARPFYVLKLRVEGAPHVQTGWYIPSSHTTRWLIPKPSEWTKLRRRGTAFLQAHLPAGPPRRAPRPVRVVVGHRLARVTAPYAHVFDRFPPAPVPPPNAHWIVLHVLWPVGTPWWFEHDEIIDAPAKRVLGRPGGWFRIPITFANVISRDAHR